MKSLITTIVVLSSALPVLAQTSKDAPVHDKTTPTAKNQPVAPRAGMQAFHKGSKLIGADVESPLGEDLGDIKELVLNPSTGEIEYAVLSFGGFLGMGDKLFALPWGVLQSSMKGDDFSLVLSIDKERLKKAPGFPKDNWPDMGTPNWADPIREFYSDDLRARPVPASTDKAVAANKNLRLLKATELMGADVKTSDDKNAGDIDEIVVDAQSGRVAYVVLATGGVLGFGKDKYAVPWQAAQISMDAGAKEPLVKLPVPQSKFEKAPAYEDGDWKRMSDPEWAREVYTFYGYPIFWTDSLDTRTDRTPEKK